MLKKKLIVEDELCPACMRVDESIIHVLWNCPASMDVWRDQDSSLRKWNSISYFFSFFLNSFEIVHLAA